MIPSEGSSVSLGMELSISAIREPEKQLNQSNYLQMAKQIDNLRLKNTALTQRKYKHYFFPANDSVFSLARQYEADHVIMAQLFKGLENVLPLALIQNKYP